MQKQSSQETSSIAILLKVWNLAEHKKEAYRWHSLHVPMPLPSKVDVNTEKLTHFIWVDPEDLQLGATLQTAGGSLVARVALQSCLCLQCVDLFCAVFVGGLDAARHQSLVALPVLSVS